MSPRLIHLIVLSSLFLLAGPSIAVGQSNVLPGGDTTRKPVLGLNFFFGSFNSGLELEVDLKITPKMSVAPRIGFADNLNAFAPGVSIRFGIIQGVRPHGFWVGPSAQFFFYNRKANRNFIMAVAAEFGWRYTFDFGLSLTPFTRLGGQIGDVRGTAVFWDIGGGVGYAF